MPNRKPKICSICGINAKKDPLRHMNRRHGGLPFIVWDGMAKIPEPYCDNIEDVLKYGAEPIGTKPDGRGG